MRDLETISMAITAAETGHLVFGTLHTMGAPQTVDRIIDVFPTDQQAQVRAQLAESIRGVISQALLPVAQGKGRVAALEIMVANSAIRNLIREAKTFQMHSVIETNTKDGMCTLDQSLKKLLREGKITREAALTKAHDPSSLEDLGTSGADAPNGFGASPRTLSSVLGAPPTPASSATPAGVGGQQQPAWGKKINY
jgi:twitching motility protein PilT